MAKSLKPLLEVVAQLAQGLAEIIDPSLVPELDDADSDEMPQLPIQIPATAISVRPDEVELLKARVADLEARISRIEAALGG